MLLIIALVGLLVACLILLTLFVLTPTAPHSQQPSPRFSLAAYLSRHRQYQLANESKLWIDVEHGGSGFVQRSIEPRQEDMSMAPSLLMDRTTPAYISKIR